MASRCSAALVLGFLLLASGCDAPESPTTAAPHYTPWPPLGRLQVGDEALFRSAGNLWYRGKVEKVGPEPGPSRVGANGYLIRDQHGSAYWYERTHTAGLTREPFWSEFFLGDWEVSVPMAMNTVTDGRDLYRVVSGGMPLPPLRVLAGGSYRWRVLENGAERVIEGQWRPREDAPGIVLLGGEQGADWTLYNATDQSTLATFGRAEIHLTADCCTYQTARRIMPDPVPQPRIDATVLVERKPGHWQLVKITAIDGDRVRVRDSYGIFDDWVETARLRRPEQ